MAWGERDGGKGGVGTEELGLKGVLEGVLPLPNTRRANPWAVVRKYAEWGFGRGKADGLLGGLLG